MKRIVVIGGGVIGLSVAYYAAQRGHSVTVLERGADCSGGCSSGNAGMIVPSHFAPLAAPGAVMTALRWMSNPESPFWVKPRLDPELFKWGYDFWRSSTAEHVERSGPLLRDLHLASRGLFVELAGLTRNSFGLVQRGLLMLCKTQHALDEEAAGAEKARKLGVPADVLTLAAVKAREPNIDLNIVGAINYPLDCHLTPDHFVQALRELAINAGVEIRYGEAVTEFRRSDGTVREVVTTKGNYTADDYVLCAGSWSTDVARQIGFRIPMQAGKGYSLTLPNPPQTLSACAILTEARVAVTPMAHGLRVGGTMEIAGLNEDINHRRIKGIVNAACDYFPAFQPQDFAGIQPWRGLRPCSPDGLPYIGRSTRVKNLCVATGHAMMGLSLAPITGKLMADILSDQRPSMNIALLNPERYA